MSKDLKPNRIKNYREHLETIISTVTETINPFLQDLNREISLNIVQVKELVTK